MEAKKQSEKPKVRERSRAKPAKEIQTKETKQGSVSIKELVKVGNIPIHEHNRTYLIAVDSEDVLDSKVSIGAGLKHSDNFNTAEISVHVSVPCKSDNDSMQKVLDEKAKFIEKNLGTRLKVVKQKLDKYLNG